jgi:hypothetical protein
MRDGGMEVSTTRGVRSSPHSDNDAIALTPATQIVCTLGPAAVLRFGRAITGATWTSPPSSPLHIVRATSCPRGSDARPSPPPGRCPAALPPRPSRPTSTVDRAGLDEFSSAMAASTRRNGCWSQDSFGARPTGRPSASSPRRRAFSWRSQAGDPAEPQPAGAPGDCSGVVRTRPVTAVGGVTQLSSLS